MKEIGRLRLKFMCYHMLIVTAVMALTFCAVALVMGRRISEQGKMALSKVAAEEEHPMIFKTISPAERPYFSVLVGADGAVTPGDGEEIGGYPGQAMLEEMAELGMAADEDMGMLDGYHMRYLRVSRPAGLLIAFADTSYEDALKIGVIKYAALACAAIWFVCFALSYLFSRWAVKPVEESIRMQKQFVADASHELKTPLTVITANTELLQERYAGLSKEADHWLDHISQECRDMRTLVEGLLTLARNDACRAGKQAFTRFSLSDLVTERVLIFEPVFYQEKKRLQYHIDDGVEMKGNPEQMGQLVGALLDNAVKYAKPEGKAEVLLESAGRKKARLSVKSEGAPIPKEKRSLIFQRFYREDSARSSGGGYGLGLAIAAETARKHRARIGVEYQDGMNCFTVVLRASSSVSRPIRK